MKMMLKVQYVLKHIWEHRLITKRLVCESGGHCCITLSLPQWELGGGGGAKQGLSLAWRPVGDYCWRPLLSQVSETSPEHKRSLHRVTRSADLCRFYSLLYVKKTVWRFLGDISETSLGQVISVSVLQHTCLYGPDGTVLQCKNSSALQKNFCN